jgi:hypothetical protein
VAEIDPPTSRHPARDVAEIGRHLAAAAGFRVVTAQGDEAGRLDHIRYERRVDVPDEIVIRPSRLLRWRRRVIDLEQVERVELRGRTIVLRSRPAGAS